MADYMDDDEQYASLLGNTISPLTAAGIDPDEAAANPQKALQQVASGRQAAPTPAPIPAPSPSVPASVTKSGDPGGQRSWADYVRGSLDKAQSAMDQSQSNIGDIQNQPSENQSVAPLETQRSQAATPIDPNQTKYRPGIGTRIVRGIDAVRRGGILGAVDPKDVGGQAYGDPNRQYGRDVARQTQEVGSLDQQIATARKNYEDATNRLKSLATDARSQATGALDIGKTATAQQKEEDAAANNQALTDVKQQVADLKAQGKAPANYEQAVIAAQTETDPKKKSQYAAAAKQMQDTEIKKFQYAQRATGGGEDTQDKRQSMIDDATEKVKTLQDTYAYDPDQNLYVNPNKPNDELSPAQFTDKKNQISTNLDKQLASKKLKTLGVRFNPRDAQGSQFRNTPASAPQSSNSLTGPIQAGEKVAVGPSGHQIVVRGNKWVDPQTGKEVK